MKNKLILLFLFVFSISFSQKITFEEVLSLKSKNLNQVKKYLNDADWEILHDHYSTEFKFGDVRF